MLDAVSPDYKDQNKNSSRNITIYPNRVYTAGIGHVVKMKSAEVSAGKIDGQLFFAIF